MTVDRETRALYFNRCDPKESVPLADSRTVDLEKVAGDARGRKVGDVQIDRGELDRAVASYDEALQLARQLLARDPRRVEGRSDVVVSLSRKASVAEAAKRPAEALSLWREALATLAPLLDLPSPRPLWQQHATFIREAIARLEAATAPDKPRPQ